MVGDTLQRTPHNHTMAHPSASSYTDAHKATIFLASLEKKKSIMTFQGIVK